jgi:putative heme degradation protein
MTSNGHRYRFSSLTAFGLLLRPKTRGTGLLTEGILDANLESTSPGEVRINLWREWQAMLADLHDVAPVWSVVRNDHCVLSVHGPYPELTFSSDQQAARARREDTTLTCHFRAWTHATAFESRCCCAGRVFGVEIANCEGQIFHRICMTGEAVPAAFAEWVQMHQATGLEDESDWALPVDLGRFHPQSFARRPGTLEVPVARLRTALLHAAEREIPLVAGVASEGATQTARLDIQRASEARDWLVLSGKNRTLYVDSETTGTLLVEPANNEGEPDWRLSLTDAEGYRLLHLRSTDDARPAWQQLVREFVL